MAKEIERRFLVVPGLGSLTLAGFTGAPIVQGYLAVDPMVVRVRTMAEKGYLATKSKNAARTKVDEAVERDEFEYGIPLEDAKAMLIQCGPNVLEKVRYCMPYQGHNFEIDFFKGRLTGLIIAEVELKHKDERVDLPPWITREITHDHRYANVNLAYYGLPDDTHYGRHGLHI